MSTSILVCCVHGRDDESHEFLLLSINAHRCQRSNSSDIVCFVTDKTVRICTYPSPPRSCTHPSPPYANPFFPTSQGLPSMTMKISAEFWSGAGLTIPFSRSPAPAKDFCSRGFTFLSCSERRRLSVVDWRSMREQVL